MERSSSLAATRVVLVVLQTRSNNFAPSLGFAWAPRFEKGFFGKVLGDGKPFFFRGGFRMDYTNDELVRAPDNALLNNTGLQQTSIVVNPVSGTRP